MISVCYITVNFSNVSCRIEITAEEVYIISFRLELLKSVSCSISLHTRLSLGIAYLQKRSHSLPLNFSITEIRYKRYFLFINIQCRIQDFPDGRDQPQGESASLLFYQISLEKLHENKRIINIVFFVCVTSQNVVNHRNRSGLLIGSALIPSQAHLRYISLDPPLNRDMKVARIPSCVVYFA